MDVFSDGTPCVGDPTTDLMQVTERAMSTGLASESIIGTRLRDTVSEYDFELDDLRKSRQPQGHHRIQPNPPAGETRKRELTSGLWLTKAKHDITVENKKAETQLETKRIVGIAKQTQLGLAKIGVRYDQTELANWIRLALAHEHEHVQHSEEIFKALQILHGAKVYDMHKVAELLGCPVSKDKTFGATKDIRTPTQY